MATPAEIKVSAAIGKISDAFQNDFVFIFFKLLF